MASNTNNISNITTDDIFTLSDLYFNFVMKII